MSSPVVMVCLSAFLKRRWRSVRTRQLASRRTARRLSASATITSTMPG